MSLGLVVAALAGAVACSGAEGGSASPDPVPVPAPATFLPLGSLPDYVGSDGLAISNDGSTVVGRALTETGPAQAFAWTKDGGMVGLGFLEGFSTSGARAVSGDGSTIAGFASDRSAMAAWRWTKATGMKRLDGGEEITPCTVSALSSDGSAIAGATNCFGGSQAYVWTAGHGLRGLGWLDADANPRMSEAKGMSADGAVVVGQSTGRGAADVRRAFRWTEREGLVELPNIAGAAEAIAWAVSPNGQCTVGHSLLANGAGVATMWTKDGVVKLGGLESPSALSIAHAVSDDCSVVVGETSGENDGVHAFVWTPARGLVQLRDLLPASDVASWTLVRANGLSPDGHRVVGSAETKGGERQAFLATLP